MNPALTSALILFFNAMLFTYIIYKFHIITDNEPLDAFTSIDNLIKFNVVSTQIRNSFLIVGLFTIAYGLYSQYRINKAIAYIIISLIFVVLSFVFLALSLLSGTFII
ncbi:MAG: hypothetical protein JWP67_3334 [Mucilaginibacter sp.]|nr:hypothetical protein [Mucilaginibacter sp.]